jgi:hypothetical protein
MSLPAISFLKDRVLCFKNFAAIFRWLLFHYVHQPVSLANIAEPPGLIA